MWPPARFESWRRRGPGHDPRSGRIGAATRPPGRRAVVRVLLDRVDEDLALAALDLARAHERREEDQRRLGLRRRAPEARAPSRVASSDPSDVGKSLSENFWCRQESDGNSKFFCRLQRLLMGERRAVVPGAAAAALGTARKAARPSENRGRRGLDIPTRAQGLVERGGGLDRGSVFVRQNGDVFRLEVRVPAGARRREDLRRAPASRRDAAVPPRRLPVSVSRRAATVRRGVAATRPCRPGVAATLPTADPRLRAVLSAS